MKELDDIGHHAAIALRDAIEEAINRLEQRIKGEPPAGPHRDYFVAQMKTFKDAIDELRPLRALAHKRVFDALSSSKEW